MGAGMDQELCGPTDNRGQCFTLAADAVKDGLLAQQALDRAAANVLRSKFAVGLFDRPYSDPAATAIINSEAHREVAKRVVTEGAVLLKNSLAMAQGGRGLPLTLSASSTVAIIGPNADDAKSQCGGCASSTRRLLRFLSFDDQLYRYVIDASLGRTVSEGERRTRQDDAHSSL